MKPDRSRANKSGQIHLLTTTRILHEGDDEVGDEKSPSTTFLADCHARHISGFTPYRTLIELSHNSSAEPKA